MAKKKKSIYDYELKDNSGDGKVNFGDTWLGDALGFDGKVGVQKQGMKASMKGARRKMGEGKSDDAPKKTDKTSTSTSGTTRPRARPESNTKTPPGSGPRRMRPKPTPSDKSKGPGVRKDKSLQVDSNSPQQPSTPSAQESIQKANSGQSSRPTSKPAGKPKTPSKDSTPKADKKPPAPIDRGITYEQWEKMSRSERKAKGLPLTVTGWQNQRWLGFNKGGMVKKEARYQQNGKRDYKGSGMFYKSGSPRGYK